MTMDQDSRNGSARALVSLCMATCLRSDLFPESFRGLLAQTYSPLEIIVLADGSDESSISLLKACDDPRVRWISTPKPSGMVPAWNRVVSEARGKYFLFCADDDVLQNKAIDRQVALLEAKSNVGFCHGDWKCIDDDGKFIGGWTSHEGDFIKSGRIEWPRYVVRTGCCMQTTVVRTSLWREVGGWDDDAGHPGDNSLYLKLLRVSDVGHVAQICCHYRIRTRIPDSWGKYVSNIQAFYRLSDKHLVSPPSFAAAKAASIRRQMSRHWSLYSIEALCQGQSRLQSKDFVEWARNTIWAQSATGVAIKWAVHFRCERLAFSIITLGKRSKMAVKRFVTWWRQNVGNQ